MAPECILLDMRRHLWEGEGRKRRGPGIGGGRHDNRHRGRPPDLLARNRLEGGRLPPLPDACRPGSEDAAYAVQFALREALIRGGGRDPVAGYKIGATSRVMQDYLDIHNPCGGGVLAGVGCTPPPSRFLMMATSSTPASSARSPCAWPPTLPAASGAVFPRERVAEVVGACMAAIEIVDDRYPRLAFAGHADPHRLTTSSRPASCSGPP